MNDAQLISPERMDGAAEPIKIVGVGHSHLVALANGFAEREANGNAWPKAQFLNMQLRKDMFRPNFSAGTENSELNELLVRRFKFYLKSIMPAERQPGCRS
jgi:hypothetical protein